MTSTSSREVDLVSEPSSSPQDSPTISVVGDGGTPPAVLNFNWSTCWPLPVAGLSYLVHMRYRRHIPRRLPTLTSMSLRELYATGAGLSIAALDVNRLTVNLAQDRDLLTIELAAALNARTSRLLAHRDLLNEMDTMHSTDIRDRRVLDRLRWSYNHMWSDIVTWNSVSFQLLPEFGNDLAREAPATSDMDICITHFANTPVRLTAAGFISYSAAVPFGKALCGITPIAMLARWFGPRMLWLSLSGIQRTLVYATAWLAAAQPHQHFAYPTTLQDKHGVAAILLRITPGLDKEVDDAIRKFSEGIAVA
ncbi:hypothetical protein C8T65DRAFT_805395 [Cerioporus squamosus]|nr:hypothetical protein C8T65DRAFT_805395 [Cerioporus squamosus]